MNNDVIIKMDTYAAPIRAFFKTTIGLDEYWYEDYLVSDINNVSDEYEDLAPAFWDYFNNTHKRYGVECYKVIVYICLDNQYQSIEIAL